MIIIDTYGGWGAHGGGAFSSNDPTKVDRYAAYLCRQMAKSIEKSGLSQRAHVQLSYAMGVEKPLSQFVETYDSECSELVTDDTTNVFNVELERGQVVLQWRQRCVSPVPGQPSTATLDAPHKI